MSGPLPATVQAADLTLHGLRWGAGGAPVLAIHGWLDNCASFARLAPLLSDQEVVALDLPGHGQSDPRPSSAHYHFVDWVVDLIAAIDGLGWERFALLGHSMGAGVAALLAGTIPERVTHLALLEGVGPFSCAPELVPARLRESAEQRIHRGRPARSFASLEDVAERIRRSRRGLTTQGAHALASRATRPGEDGSLVWSGDRRLRDTSPLRLSEAHVEAFFRRVTAPTLVIRARDGLSLPPDHWARRVDWLRGRQLDVQGMHHVHLDHPERVAPPLAEFYAGTVDDPGGSSVPARARELRVLVLDVDGVLTRGELHYGPAGETTKVFHVRDGMGIKLLQRSGLPVVLLSGRDCPALRRRAADLGIETLELGTDDKRAWLEEFLQARGWTWRHVAYMGDDLNDLGVVERVGLPAAPADAHPEVRRRARFVSTRPGGGGAVREFAEELLRARGQWEEGVRAYRDR